MNEYKTHTCNEISLEDVGKKVRIAGWVQTIRDFGGLVFLDIRDMYGITQVVTSGKPEDVDFASHIPIESAVTVFGTVRKRDEETVNPKLKTGLVEIGIEEIKVLGKRTENLPFEVNTNQEIREDLRLQYRYLDLRNERLQNNLKLRAQVLQFLRNQMQEQGFLEVQTPILTSSSPEGARDYLVPSRLHPGKFYALPQAPQQFKQLLMVSGIDKYFQIAPCFRDEDARADRAPGEFYQLDMEMSFATQEDVFKVMEPVMYNTFKQFSNKKIAEYPFPRITYKEAMLKYGSDKPDLRNPLIIQDATKIFALAISNACVGLSGGLMAQYQGYADINSSVGILVVGLASVIIGEVIFGRRSVTIGIISAVVGSIVYRYIMALATATHIFPAFALKLVSACIVGIALSIPAVKEAAALSKIKKEAGNDAHN